jgi:penicillin-binding protein 1A
MKTTGTRMKTAKRILWRLTFLGIIAFVTFIMLINFEVFGPMPSIQDLQNPSASIASEVYADNGQLMGKFYLEDRSPVEMKDISPNVINALIATEDERFYDHSGIDGKSVVRAVFYLGREGGGSTITQQLALNLFGGQRATNKISRAMQKLKEWIIAVKLERNFTKDEIITYYLNTVPFGDNVYGIRNAARTFFQKEPGVLTVDEAAVLIGMLKGNTQYNPRRHPEEARVRRNVVLDQMVRNDKLSAAEAERLKPIAIPLKYKKLDQNEGIAPYFRENVLKDEVKELLKDKKKPNGEAYDIYRDGLKIFTTINPTMQRYGEEAMAKNMPNKQNILNSQGNIRSGSVWKGHEAKLEQYVRETDRWKDQKEDGMSDADNRKTFDIKQPMKIFAWNTKRQRDTVMTPFDSIRYHRQFLQSGFMAMDPVSGVVKCWVGGVDYKTFKYDHVNVKSSRQVGSIIKPLLYALAMEEAGFTPESPLQNAAQYFSGFGWVPAKRGGGGGSVPMFKALAHSLNPCAAYLMKQVGPKRFVEFLNTCNVQHKVDPFPSIALGSCDLSLYEMMWMYTMFAGRGFNTKPQFITRIEDRNGNVLLQVQQQHKEVISEVTAYTMAKMMGGAIKFGTAKDWNSYGVKAETGAKTGTTNDNSDAWFMVYTPQLLCGTWVGCDDRFVRFATTGVGQGGKAALPTCGNFMKAVYNDKTLDYDSEAEFQKPTVGKEDIIYDYIQGINAMYRPDAQAQDFGNGEDVDYMDYSSGDSYTESADTTSSATTKTENNDGGYGDETPKKEEVVKPDTAKAVMPELSRRERRKLEKQQKKDLENKKKQEEKSGDDY